jgi:hypothetical protein
MTQERVAIWKIRLEVASRLATLIGLPLLWIALTWAREVDQTIAKQGEALTFMLQKQAEISANVERGTTATVELVNRVARLEGAQDK